MIREIQLDEAEHFGMAEAGSSIKFSRLLDWFNKVNAAQNASYLKCVVATSSGCVIFNIADIMLDKDLVHNNVNYAHGVKIAFKEAADQDAMTIAKAAELFEKIAAVCAENGIPTEDVQVFTLDPKDRLARFCWFYDDQYDTAYIVRNMPPSKARKWLQAGAEVLAEVAKSPKKPAASQEKELYAYWLDLFGVEGAKEAWKKTFPDRRTPRV